MKATTQKFLKLWESNGDVRKSIKTQVSESRFYSYAKELTNVPEIERLAKLGKEKELANYIKVNNGNLSIPVKLTDLGIRRMATALVLMFKED